MYDPAEYSIIIKMTEEDGGKCYLGTVRELPDVLVCEDSWGETYENVLLVIESLQAAAQESGRPFPAPFIEQHEHSGRVTLRMSKSLHARCVAAAAADDVSLNQWIVEAVACRVEGKATANPFYMAVTNNYDVKFLGLHENLTRFNQVKLPQSENRIAFFGQRHG